mmetsp:Transcript_482/g.614  ORF Transcript_482/g.614 Transcript_482/m.614 type:complete len:224 (+) Transcript_482:470-1141(+)
MPAPPNGGGPESAAGVGAGGRAARPAPRPLPRGALIPLPRGALTPLPPRRVLPIIPMPNCGPVWCSGASSSFVASITTGASVCVFVSMATFLRRVGGRRPVRAPGFLIVFNREVLAFSAIASSIALILSTAGSSTAGAALGGLFLPGARPTPRPLLAVAGNGAAGLNAAEGVAGNFLLAALANCRRNRSFSGLGLLTVFFTVFITFTRSFLITGGNGHSINST